MATFYFVVFVVGLALTVVSFASGVAGDFLGDLFGDGGADAGDAGHSHGHGHVPLVNFGTVCAFMTWFGGIGYLLTAYSVLVGLATASLAAAGGVVGAGVVFLFMAKLLATDNVPMRASDFYMPGTLGRVTVTIPAGGTGEIVYTQGGSRKTAAARGESGQAVERGVEVVVMRYERGVAYVQPWDEAAVGRGDAPSR